MRIHAAVSALITGLVFATAVEARPDARSMTCKQLQVLVADERVVIMDTGPKSYKRFVYHRGFCSTQETAVKAWIDASDGECQLRECRMRRINDD